MKNCVIVQKICSLERLCMTKKFWIVKFLIFLDRIRMDSWRSQLVILKIVLWFVGRRNFSNVALLCKIFVIAEKKLTGRVDKFFSLNPIGLSFQSNWKMGPLGPSVLQLKFLTFFCDPRINFVWHIVNNNASIQGIPSNMKLFFGLFLTGKKWLPLQG